MIQLSPAAKQFFQLYDLMEKVSQSNTVIEAHWDYTQTNMFEAGLLDILGIKRKEISHAIEQGYDRTVVSE